MKREQQAAQKRTRKLEALDPLLHPKSRDLLHQESQFVDHFYDLVTTSINPPFSISIDGLWGSGKTSIMKMLQNRLDARWKIDAACLEALKNTGMDSTVLEQLQSLKNNLCYTDQQEFRNALAFEIGEAAFHRYGTTIVEHAELQESPYPTFWFNPWKYQDAENIVLAFLQDLSQQACNKIKQGISEGLKLLSVIGLLGIDASLSRLNLSLKGVKDMGELLEKNWNTPSEGYTDVLKEIEKEFTALVQKISNERDGKPVIIFFDDLDRCLPEKAIALLEAVKNLFIVPDTPVIFVCGIDTHIAKQFIRSRYNNLEDSFAINYFRKIFNISFSMPANPPVYTLLTEYIQELMGWNAEEAEKLAGMLNTRGVQAEITSVRKFLNVVHNLYTFQSFNPNYRFTPDKDFVVYLLLIKEAWYPLYRELLQEALKNRSESVESSVSKVKKACEARKEPLLKEQEEFLANYLSSESEFGEEGFYDLLKEYPTLP
ncbi:hypothetical protein CSA56_08075 [candidate division KSB3 bacterium]|uniref:KAP NTPase domain-containing protein n=1 Tax=candidate division KSB3 bacterium TaxID=2044937 RepID=A0A2G6KF94_9BACT|nr:MAG: hypothetical protein CSA56_08075 [candidate division KSB3 bacterium]